MTSPRCETRPSHGHTVASSLQQTGVLGLGGGSGWTITPHPGQHPPPDTSPCQKCKPRLFPRPFGKERMSLSTWAIKLQLSRHCKHAGHTIKSRRRNVRGCGEECEGLFGGGVPTLPVSRGEAKQTLQQSCRRAVKTTHKRTHWRKVAPWKRDVGGNSACSSAPLTHWLLSRKSPEDGWKPAVGGGDLQSIARCPSKVRVEPRP